MGIYDEYRFKIDAYSPETIPMARLAEYMQEFAQILANTENVHFSNLESGSTVLVSRVQYEAAPKVSKRLDEIHRGDTPDDAVKAVARINDMLRDDNAVGSVLYKAANDSNIQAEVLRFPGKEIPRPQKIGPFTESAVVDGELVRIGGRDETAHALILDVEGKQWNSELSRELAQQIASYLYKGPILRFEGDARWLRTESGNWELRNFRIKSFKTLSKDALEKSVKRLRQIEGSEWNKLDSPRDFILEQRGIDDEIH